MPVFIDPTSPTNGAGTFADPRNTWVGITWSAGETYLQKEGTTFAGAASIGPSQNNITFGTYDAGTGAQITDNTRHATIANVGGQGINCNSRTGLVIDNLRIIGDGSATSRNAIQALYASSTTALNLTVRRCILSASTTSSSPLRVRGDGLLIEDSVLIGEGVANSAAYLETVNATIRRTHMQAAANTALFVTTTANTETEPVNLLVEDSTFNAYGATANAGDGATVRGRGVTFRRCNSEAAWDNSILIRGQNITLTDNDLRGFNRSGADGDGIQLVGTHDVLSLEVARNYVGDPAVEGAKQCLILGDPGATAPTSAPRVYGNTLVGMAFGAILNIPDTQFTSNTMRRQTGSGFVLSADDQKARANVVEDATVNVAAVDPGVSGCEIENTTGVRCGRGLDLANTATTARNNHIQLRASAYAVRTTAATATLDGNLYECEDGTVPTWIWNSTTYTTLSAWKAASSQDATSTNQPSQSTREGRPLPGSPLLTDGADIGYRRDIRGHLSRKHIGAFGAARLIRTR